MAEIGQGPRGLVAGAYVVAASAAALALWGFTVDDALISVQYARNLASGVGYRFDPGGIVTDGVTPLPWPFLLYPLAKGGALDVLFRARLLGAVLYVIASGVLGVSIARTTASRFAKLAGAFVLLFCIPAAAHAVTGMETAVVIFLATLAVAIDDDRIAALFAGLAAAFRPEMIPWALAFGALRPSSGRGRAIGASLALAPPLLVIVARVIAFGHAAPLAIHAKPADLGQGFTYAIAAAVSSATLWFGVSIIAVRIGGRARAIVVAYVIHLFAMAAAGGDWMPLARLVAPVAPGLIVAFVLASAELPRWSLILRAVLFVAFGWVPVLVGVGNARYVYSARRDLIARAEPELAHCTYVAAADVGWVSAAMTPGGRILDLGGLTDPEIAYLPGSHTSKRVDATMLLDRKVDCVLLYVEGPTDLAHWREAPFAHAVDARLADSTLFADRYDAVSFLPLGKLAPNGAPARGYIVLRVHPSLP